MGEIDILLNELRNMKINANSNNVQNTRETWSKLGQGKWKEAGFASEEEAIQFISDNPYVNI